MRRLAPLAALAAVCTTQTACLLAQEASSVTSCKQFEGQTFSHQIAQSTNWVAAGPVTVPGPKAGTETTLILPEHCTVHLVSEPVRDSHIEITLWLPDDSAWNGKLLATGNGGYSSLLSYADMADGLRRGYVVGGSDTGHTGDDMRFGDHHPEKIRDWAYRSTHELATAEAWTALRLYGRKPAHAYFRGCSTGGQQALSEAQRYPADFDGIIAGDPGNDRILLNADFMASWLTAHPESGPAFPHAKLKLLAKAAMDACDRKEGVADGVIDDPRACTFDPQILVCQGSSDKDACLSPVEANMARTLYAGSVRDSSGKPLYFGWPRGSELGWGSYFIDPSEPTRLDFWRFWVYDDPSFDPRRFNAQQSIADARKKIPYTEAVSADLSEFAKHGGKLLMYHGWADPVVPPENSIAYFNAVRQRTPGDFLQLFMVPGMGHCGGGPGANDFDALAVLDRWVTSAVPPKSMLAEKQEGGKVVLERPLCPYPQASHWDGTHDVTKASSFHCAN